MGQPRLFRALLAIVVTPSDREFLLRDMAEEFRHRVAAGGARAARNWYRLETLRSLGPCLRRRATLALRGFTAGLSAMTSHRKGGGTMDQWLHDVRFAFRSLRKRPGFTVVAVVTLAVGIGANTTIFTVANGLLLKPLPGLGDTERLVEVSRNLNGNFFDLSYPVAAHFRDNSTAIEDLAGFAAMPMALSEDGQGEPQVVMGLNATGNYFSILGVEPQLGRFFAPEEAGYPRVEPVVVLGHRIWRERFNRDHSVIGRTIRVNDYPVTVIGVAPEEFAGHVVGLVVDLFVPLGLPAAGLRTPATLDNPESGVLESIALLREGITADQAGRALEVEARQFLNSVVGGYEEGSYQVRVVPWGPVPAVGRAGVMLFFGVMLFLVALVLVLASVNVAGMLLSRALERSREIAVRLSLGASRRRLVRQLLTETLVLFLTSGVVALVLTVAFANLLLAVRPALPEWINLRLDFTPDWRVLLFAGGVSAMAALAFGLAPALKATAADLATSLKDGGLNAAPARTRLRGLMVAGQMAASLVLLVAAGLFVRSIHEVGNQQTGWNSDGLYVISLDLEYLGMPREAGRTFYLDLLQRVRALPGIEQAALDVKLPIGGRSSRGWINVPGVQPPEGAGGYDAFTHTVSAGYFEALDIAIERGRGFAERDGDSDELVAVINMAMARRLWPEANPVGERFYIGTPAEGTPVRVIGVAENAVHDIETLNAPNGTVPDNYYYLSSAQQYSSDQKLYLKPVLGNSSALREVHRVIREMAPSLPATTAAELNDLLGLFVLPQRIAAWVVGSLGLLGLLLGAVGVYGVTAVAVGQRTREIGVRLALGASAGDVLRLMMSRGLRAPLAGMVVGLALAVLVGALLVGSLPGIDAGLLGRVSAVDPPTYGAVVALLACVAGLAVLIPASRASRMDPADTLRQD